MKTLLLISPALQEVQQGDLLQKGKGNRDGLIQQIVTYVRDGHTITRKQWVRSEFAEHASKNEDEKRATLLKKKERENNKHDRDVKLLAEKQQTANKRAAKKVEKRKEESSESEHKGKSKVKPSPIDATKKKVKKLTESEEQKRKKDEEKRKLEQKKSESKAKDKDKRSAYGQVDQTRADNRQQQKMMAPPVES